MNVKQQLISRFPRGTFLRVLSQSLSVCLRALNKLKNIIRFWFRLRKSFSVQTLMKFPSVAIFIVSVDLQLSP